MIGDTGLVFPEENATALADRLRGLADDPALRRHLAQAGRERALREFTVEVQLRGLRELFAEAVARQGRECGIMARRNPCANGSDCILLQAHWVSLLMKAFVPGRR